MGDASGLSIAVMKRADETAGGRAALDAGLDRLWSAMDACIDRGLAPEGTLPGGLKVRRRARAIHQALVAERGNTLAQPHIVNDWLSVYAMAVNDQNAADGRADTAPTNGAAGVVPAAIRYDRDHRLAATHAGARDFLLAAAAIGGIIKTNALISGAGIGCQGDVGSAFVMTAAETALEHHLGVTCDPVAGLVRVPCIKRNGLGAIKAVTPASLALHGYGTQVVPLNVRPAAT